MMKYNNTIKVYLYNLIHSINTGAALTSLGIGLLALFTDTAPFGEMYGFLLIAGAGAGMVYACGTVAAQSACEKHELGKAYFIVLKR
jgi:hypothetical protein